MNDSVVLNNHNQSFSYKDEDKSTQLILFKLIPSILLWIFTPFWLSMLKRKSYPFKFNENSWNFITKIVNFVFDFHRL